MDIQAQEMILAPAEWIQRMQLRPLYQHEIIRCTHRVDPRDRVVIGQTEKVVPLGGILIEPRLRRDAPVGVGRMGVQITL